MAESLVNGAKTTLAADITAAATSLTIQAADAAAFPASGTYRIQVSDGTHTELMTVTGGQGTSTLTVTRASESYGGVQTAFAFAAATPTTIGQMLTLTGLQTYIPENALLTGTSAARPAAAKAGRLYLATDALDVALDTGSLWKLVNTGQQNLLVNPGLENWQRGTAFGSANTYTADGWQMVVAGTDLISTSKDTTHVDVGSNACAFLSFTLGTGAGGSGLVQVVKMSEHALQGKLVTVSVRVSTTLANAIRLNVSSDGTGGSGGGSSAHPGDGVYHTLTATAVVATNATLLNIAINLYAGTTQAFYVDNSVLTPSSIAMDYAPLSSAEEWARCLRRYQRWPATGSGPLHLIATGDAAGPSSGYMILPMQAHMGGAPTLTFSAVSDWTLTNTVATGVCTGLSIYAASGSNVALQATCAGTPFAGAQALMLQGTNPGTGAVWLALEWNP